MEDGIQLQILGSGTCVPSLERSSAAALVSCGNTHILIDAGPGTMGQLLRAGVAIDEVDWILFTHFHPDHCSEWVPFLFSTKYPELTRTKPLYVAGGEGLLRYYDQLCQIHGHNIQLPHDLFFLSQLGQSGEFVAGALDVQFATVDHKPESRAFRLSDTWGHSIVYSGDTDYSQDLVDLALGADVFVIESSTPDGEKVPGHLTPSLAGDMAERAGVGKVVLTHLYPACDAVDIQAQCQARFSGDVVVAKDLMRIQRRNHGH